MVKSIRAEQSYIKIQHLFKTNRNKGEFTQLDKEHLQKPSN